MRALQQFSSFSNFRRLILEVTYLVALSPRRHAFCHIGSENTGILRAHFNLLRRRGLASLSQVCAYNMPPVELEGLRETFESIDRNHSGTISLEELTSHLQVKIST